MFPYHSKNWKTYSGLDYSEMDALLLNVWCYFWTWNAEVNFSEHIITRDMEEQQRGGLWDALPRDWRVSAAMWDQLKTTPETPRGVSRGPTIRPILCREKLVSLAADAHLPSNILKQTNNKLYINYFSTIYAREARLGKNDAEKLVLSSSCVPNWGHAPLSPSIRYSVVRWSEEF